MKKGFMSILVIIGMLVTSACNEPAEVQPKITPAESVPMTPESTL